MIEVKQVTANLFRGPRPKSKEDLDKLWELGIRTIISLEEGWGNLFRSYDDERKDWKAMSGKHHQIPVGLVFPPAQDQCDEVLEIATKDDGFVYIHCYSGVDRTGFMSGYVAYKTHVYTDMFSAWRQEVLDKGMHYRYYWWKSAFIRRCNGEG